MSRMRADCKIYIGDLPRDAEEAELESAFRAFGKVSSVWVARNPPGFGFVEMEDPRDAEEAVDRLDGTVVCGVRVRVEMSNGRPKSNGSRRDRGGDRGGGGRRFDPNDRCYQCGARGHYAYSCPNGRRGSGRDDRDRRSTSYRSRSRSLSRDRSRRRSRTRSYSNSRSRSPPPRRRRRSPSDRSISRSRSRSPPPRRERSYSSGSSRHSR